MIEVNKIIQGDCMELMEDIKDGSIDMILCDPPYGKTSCSWDEQVQLDKMWTAYKRIIKPNGVIVITGIQPFTSFVIMSNLDNYKYNWVWVKPQGIDPFKAKLRPLNNIEDIMVFCYGKVPYYAQMETGKNHYNNIRDTTPRFSETTGTLMKQTKTFNKGTRWPKRTLEFRLERGYHPTQKPTKLFEYLIRTYTKDGEVVLDPYAGSFTTAIACIKANRNWICMEKEDKYCKIGQERIDRYYNERR
jgi:site-specific DNA-methyltransferase (adenine-specific)